MPIKTINEIIAEGIMPGEVKPIRTSDPIDNIPKRLMNPVEFKRQPVRTIPKKETTSSASNLVSSNDKAQRVTPKKNFIRNKRGELIEQKPLGYFRNELKEKFLEYSLMNPVVPTLTHHDMLMKWREDRAKLEQLKQWKEKRLQDEAKAKRESVVIDKKPINEKA